MTQGLENISVRIYRVDNNEIPIIKGTGTLFENEGQFFVLTAFHCLQNKDKSILLDLNLTRVTFFFQSKKDQSVNVEILDIIDEDPEKDWILLSVKKPQVDWDYNGRVLFSNQIEMKHTYECFSYVSDYNGYGRYIRLIPTCPTGGYWHISEEITGGRYVSDLLMKGASGSGVMYSDGKTFCCFGLLTKALDGGAFNDVCSVELDDVMSILSSGLIKSYTKQEMVQIKRRGITEELNRYENLLLQADTLDKLRKITQQLLSETIPALIESLHDECAFALLNTVNDNCDNVLKEDTMLKALYHYLIGRYWALKGNSETAIACFHQAYLLDSENPIFVEIESQIIWKQGNREDAFELAQTLPEKNEIRQAMTIIYAKSPEKAFSHLPTESKESYKLRYKILELGGADFNFAYWLFDIKVVIPETLTLANFSEWLFLFNLFRVQLRDYLILDRHLIPDVSRYRLAFNTACKFYEKAEGTSLMKSIPLLMALQCYWGYICDEKNASHWLKRYQEIELGHEDEFQRELYVLMQGAMLSMERRYDDAFNLVVNCPIPSRNITLFVIALSNVSHRFDFFCKLVDSMESDGFKISHAESQQLLVSSRLFDPDIFLPVLDSLSFDVQAEKRVLSDFCKFTHGVKANTEDYPRFDYLIEDNLSAAVAQMMFDSGKQEEALDYLKGKFVEGTFDDCELLYIDLLSKTPSRTYELFENIKRMRQNGQILNEQQLRMEYNYSLALGDLDNALEVIELLWQENKTDEWVITAYIDLLGRKRPQELPNWINEVIRFPFSNDVFIKTVYYAFAKNKYVEDATLFLYTKVKDIKNSALSAFYDQEVIMGFASKVANRPYERVIEGCYVVYTTDGNDRHCRQMSSDTVLGRALMGHHLNDLVKLDIAGQTKTIRVLGIHNEYYHLHYSNMRDIMESGGNQYFTPFHIESDDSDEALNQLTSFLAQFNDWDAREKAMKQYKSGDLGLINLFNENDAVGSYYGFLFSKFALQVKSYDAYKRDKPDLMGNQFDYVLDLTSLFLLFEFSLLHQEWQPKKEFKLPKLLYSMIEDYKKGLSAQSSVYLHQALAEGFLYGGTLEDKLNNIQDRFDSLLKWVEQHCELVTNPAILQIQQPMQSVAQQLFSYTMVELLQQPPTLKVMITEDWHIERLIKTALPIISTETYMYEVEGTSIGQAFTEFLIKNHNELSNE